MQQTLAVTHLPPELFWGAGISERHTAGKDAVWTVLPQWGERETKEGNGGHRSGATATAVRMGCVIVDTSSNVYSVSFHTIRYIKKVLC